LKGLQTSIAQLKKDIEDNKPDKLVIIEIANILEIISEQISTDILKIQDKQETLISYLKNKKFTQHSDIILDIAYFMERFKHIDSFTIEDIRKMYDEARIKPPVNLSDSIAKLEKFKGFLIECKEKKDGRKAWRLSSQGLNYIESFFFFIFP